MGEKKEDLKISELMKSGSKVEVKKSFKNLKNFKAKTSIKKVGRSRTQKGHKNY